MDVSIGSLQDYYLPFISSNSELDGEDLFYTS